MIRVWLRLRDHFESVLRWTFIIQQRKAIRCKFSIKSLDLDIDSLTTISSTHHYCSFSQILVMIAKFKLCASFRLLHTLLLTLLIVGRLWRAEYLWLIRVECFFLWLSMRTLVATSCNIVHYGMSRASIVESSACTQRLILWLFQRQNCVIVFRIVRMNLEEPIVFNTLLFPLLNIVVTLLMFESVIHFLVILNNLKVTWF